MRNGMRKGFGCRGAATRICGALAVLFLAGGLVSATAEEGIEVAPRAIYSMGTAPLGEPLTLIFRLRNPDASQPMKIRSFQAEAPGFAVEPPADTIAAGDTVSFRVTLLAQEAGSFSLPVGMYLETDPESGIDPLVSFQISGKVIGPDGE